MYKKPAGDGYHWHKRYHSASLKGMKRLTLEERGAYCTILDLMYEQRAALNNDDVEIAHEMRCSVRKWRTIKAALVAKGRIVVEEAILYDERAVKELVDASRLRETLSAAGKRGAQKKRAQPVKRPVLAVDNAPPSDSKTAMIAIESALKISDRNAEISPKSLKNGRSSVAYPCKKSKQVRDKIDNLRGKSSVPEAVPEQRAAALLPSGSSSATDGEAIEGAADPPRVRPVVGATPALDAELERMQRAAERRAQRKAAAA